MVAVELACLFVVEREARLRGLVHAWKPRKANSRNNYRIVSAHRTGKEEEGGREGMREDEERELE